MKAEARKLSRAEFLLPLIAFDCVKLSEKCVKQMPCRFLLTKQMWSSCPYFDKGDHPNRFLPVE